MGAWHFIAWRLRKLLDPMGRSLFYAGRSEGASTAVGSLGVHKREQRRLVEDAFSVG
jgi:2-oxoglutarate dehydrogenase E1 component